MSSVALERRLRAGEFVITAEITPPLSADPQALLDMALPLRGVADAVNVTDGASARAHLDVLTAAGILVRAGIEPVLQLTCRDRNRIALQSMLVGAAAQGVHNILVLRGDDPERRRSARCQAGVRSGFQYAAGHRGRRFATAASCRTAARWAARPIFFWERPTRRSIRRPTGSPRVSSASSRPARSSCRRSSASIPEWCAATSSAWASTAHRAAVHPDRPGAAGLGALGALDPPAPVRLDHPRRADRAAGGGRRSEARGPPHLRRADAADAADSGRRRGAPDGAAQQRRAAAGDRRVSRRRLQHAPRASSCPDTPPAGRDSCARRSE